MILSRASLYLRSFSFLSRSLRSFSVSSTPQKLPAVDATGAPTSSGELRFRILSSGLYSVFGTPPEEGVYRRGVVWSNSGAEARRRRGAVGGLKAGAAGLGRREAITGGNEFCFCGVGGVRGVSGLEWERKKGRKEGGRTSAGLSQSSSSQALGTLLDAINSGNEGDDTKWPVAAPYGGL